jgi:predicted phage terminase large subunit-like protein
MYTKPDYEVNWHHRLLSSYLDRFAAGELRRLMVFLPPRTGKSELASRRLPAYLLGRNPDAQIIACSYSADLASRMNRDVQRIMDSPQYAELFPGTKLYGKNIRTLASGAWLRNSDIFEVVGHRGCYRSAGVGGGIIGMGYFHGIIDDPVKNAEEAASPTIRENIWDWYTSTFLTRQEKNGCILIMMTRWSGDDLAGRLLKLQETDPRADQWTVLSFPAIAEEPIAAEDPRYSGEALWPNKFPAEELDRMRATVGAYQWAALYQQRPTAREGGLFCREWFTILNVPPANTSLVRVRYWDLAATEAKKGADPDWTVGVLMGRSRDGRVFVLDVRRTRATPAGVEALVRQTAELDGRTVPVVIEQEPGSASEHLIDRYVRHVLPGWDVRGDRPKGARQGGGDKVTRAQPLSAQAENGNVYLVKGPWVGPYLEELELFPRGAHDDQVDASSGAFGRLTRQPTSGPPQMLGGGFRMPHNPTSPGMPAIPSGMLPDGPFDPTRPLIQGD